MKPTEFQVQILAEREDGRDLTPANLGYLQSQLAQMFSGMREMGLIMTVADQEGAVTTTYLHGKPSEELKEMSWK